MRIGLTGQHSAPGALTRTGLAALGIMLTLGLAACTTAEGTNALTDFGTFEREVMTSTARGVGLLPGEVPKEDLTSPRAPLVLPASGQALPAPAPEAAVAQLPANSDTVQIDTTNLSEADMQRLRNARVVDLRSLSGRPLTEQEARTLTARMQAANMQVTASGKRPLYLPPDEYFTRVGDAQLVCSTPGGELVAVNDPKCPEAVRKAIRDAANAKAPSNSTSFGGSVGLTEKETTLQ